MFRVPKNKRTVYVLENVTKGAKVTLRPSENGLTEADIDGMHRSRDDEVNSYKQFWRNDRKNIEIVALDAIDPSGAWLSDSKDQFEIVHLHDAIARLPEKQAKAIKAVYFEDMTAAEYAILTGTSEANISKLLKKARKNLKKDFFEWLSSEPSQG